MFASHTRVCEVAVHIFGRGRVLDIHLIDVPRFDIAGADGQKALPYGWRNAEYWLRDINIQVLKTWESANIIGQATTYDSYDANGRVLSITDPNGLVTVYTYDARGRVASITQTAPGGATRTTQYGYNTAGDVTSVSLPTGLALSYT